MTDLDSGLLDAVRAWQAGDPDPETREELDDLTSAAQAGDAVAVADLADRFAGTLEFGTAGLRGVMEGGPNRMNRAVVIRAAAGLAAFLTERAHGEFIPRVVIGYDARHHSEEFARDSAAVMTAAGLEVLLLSGPRPTPVLAFAVQSLSAEAGVMVTASHNPPRDNGYKVYAGGRLVDPSARGAQIIPPFDAQIAAHIDAAPPAASIRLATAGWQTLAHTRVEGYIAGAAALARPQGDKNISIVYTAMHGVGADVASEALARAGFDNVTMVAEQNEPDPDFPTLPFPNPEEPGALDCAIMTARRTHAELIIANDPDADRCAVAVPDQGEWRQLTGDEVGALIGTYMAGRAVLSPESRFANSIVSSRLLARIAADRGIDHRETLTGFKWIARVPGLVFGYEEAIGYCVDPSHVRDKDGIATAVLIAQFAAELAATTRTLLDVLDDLAQRHGVHVSAPVTIRVDDLAEIGRLLSAFEAAPPTELAGSPVLHVDDLRDGGALPPTPGMRLITEDDSRLIVRPSGTEPKLKCYLEVVEPVTGDLRAARERAGDRMSRLAADVRRALDHES